MLHFASLSIFLYLPTRRPFDITEFSFGALLQISHMEPSSYAIRCVDPASVARSAGMPLTLVAGASTELAPVPHNMPSELICRVFELACMPAPIGRPEPLLRLRDTICSLSKSFSVFVDNNPIFWTTLFITPRLPMDKLLVFLQRMQLEPFHLTVRVAHATSYDPASNAGAYESADEFMEDATSLVTDRMDRYLSLAVEAQDLEVLSFLLDQFKMCDPDMLELFSTRFHAQSYDDFDSPAVKDFSFLGEPAYGEAVDHFDTLIIIPSAYPSGPTSILRVSGPSHVLRIDQPANRPFTWDMFMTIVLSSPNLYHIVLDGVDIDLSVYSGLVLTPLVELTMMDIAFRGKSSMAQLLSFVFLPALEALVVTLDGCADVEILKTCRRLLRPVKELTIKGDCHCDYALHEIFGLVPRLRYLDIRRAHTVFMVGLRVASLDSCSRSVYPPACPALLDVLCSGVQLRDLRHLIQARELSGYQEMSSIHVYGSPSGEDPEVIAWFGLREVDLHVHN
ncbi:hypothetical protein C8J57DRAFT_1546944 [Mycena rebaudengoi]|nr:hypothetical protein C8J57DRAFT_1546944 [Mycena rebaudengoi]